MTPSTPVDPRANRLLAGLEEHELARLAPHLEPVWLPRPAELEGVNEPITYAYFPTSGIASIVALGDEGQTVDTAMIGREGMTGLSLYLGTGHMPTRTIVQVPMTGLRVHADYLRSELRSGGTIIKLLRAHTHVLLVTMAQLILCNRLHRLDQRAARWLLQVDDRVDEKPFDVTQEFLAEMIGVQRPALSVAMRQFKAAGLVEYSRGRVRIADREGLAARSCACAEVIAAEGRRLDALEDALART